MKKFSSFIFDSYAFSPEKGTIELKYALDDELKFTETITFPRPPELAPASRSALERAMHALHLMGGISYFKTCLPHSIVLRTHPLAQDQAEFWNTVYEEGLGEFFFRNGINPKGLISFPSSGSPLPGFPTQPRKNRKKVLVPVGGGKDSIVTMELLRSAGFDVTLLRIGKHPLIDAIASTAHLPLLTVERFLDPLLFQLNTDGALNGHVPVTAYLSLLSIITAILYGFDAVVMSNERSASYGNTIFHGKEINHQWSKSLEFEKLLRDYAKNCIVQEIEYFSLLRPLSELSIAGIFSRFPQYFNATTSCNANWRILGERPNERWCGSCPKCAFVFALFAAFLPEETLVQIFGKNLFAESSLLPLYRELLGCEKFKPFECVGTPEETKAAFLLLAKEDRFKGTPVMDMFEKTVKPKIADPDALIGDALAASEEHCLTPEFASLVIAR